MCLYLLYLFVVNKFSSSKIFIASLLFDWELGHVKMSIFVGYTVIVIVMNYTAPSDHVNVNISCRQLK